MLIAIKFIFTQRSSVKAIASLFALVVFSFGAQADDGIAVSKEINYTQVFDNNFIINSVHADYNYYAGRWFYNIGLSKSLQHDMVELQSLRGIVGARVYDKTNVYLFLAQSNNSYSIDNNTITQIESASSLLLESKNAKELGLGIEREIPINRNWRTGFALSFNASHQRNFKIASFDKTSPPYFELDNYTLTSYQYRIGAKILRQFSRKFYVIARASYSATPYHIDGLGKSYVNDPINYDRTQLNSSFTFKTKTIGITTLLIW